MARIDQSLILAHKRSAMGMRLHKWIVLAVVLLAGGMAWGAQDVENDEIAPQAIEEESKDHSDTEQPSPPLFWDIRLQMTLGESDVSKLVRFFLPVSERRQTILRRSVYHGPLSYRETTVGENLLGIWEAKEGMPAETVVYDFTVRIDGERQAIPVNRAERGALKEYLESESRIQAQAPVIRAQAKQVAPPKGSSREQVRALYDFVHTAILRENTSTTIDALTALKQRRADQGGKARLLVALLRASKIPARLVGGLQLKDLKRRKGYSYWVEAVVDDEWIELDPTRGHFGHVPNRNLVLFRGDYPLIRYSAGVEFQYEFLVMQTTRDAAEGVFTEFHMDEDEGRGRLGNEKAMTTPVASIVWISDRSLAPSLIEKFSALASEEHVKVTFLTVPYESKLFRGEQIEDLIKSYDSVIRHADVLVLHTRDDAGLFALMSQGGRSGTFKKKLIYVNGNIYRGVARFFGNGLHDMLHPKGLYVVPKATDPNDFWDIVYDNFLNGVPIHDVAAKWDVPLLQFSEKADNGLNWFREFLIQTWVQASEAGVTPHAIGVVMILPLIALVIVIYRGIIGIETFGTFTPALICVAFLRTGVFWGLFLFFVILGIGIALRSLLSRVHLFLVARMALLISLVAMVMMAASIVGIWWGVGPLVNVSVFPMVIIAGMIENFTRTQMEVGLEEAIQLSASTLGICVVSYLLIEWFDLQSIIIVYPEVLLLIMGLIVAIGLWRGLRLVELWKFYRVGKTS